MEIYSEIKDKLAVVNVSGSITSQTAMEFETAIANYPGDNKGIIIDFKKLDFISSAGLRVVLSAKKRCKGKIFKIINANPSVMNVFQVTGFSEIMDIEKAPRQVDVTGCKIIGSGACGECYRLDDETIIKLYYPHISKEEIEKEKLLAKKAFVMGVPTAISYDIVECDGRSGVVYELLNCKTLAELLREDTNFIHFDEYIKLYAEMCKQIHSIDGKDALLPTFKDLNRVDIPNVTDISEEERDYLYKFLDIVPDRTTCIHGDLNPNNVMFQDGELRIIDMGEFSTGIYLFDISRLVFTFEFAPDRSVDINNFYKLPHATLDRVYNSFVKYYFGYDSIEEASKHIEDGEWLYPLAWFRVVTSMLKANRWTPEKRKMAGEILKEKLIPFIKSKIDK